MNMQSTLRLDGESLCLADIAAISSLQSHVRCELSHEVTQQMQASIDVLQDKIDHGDVIYGVNTLFGGMAKGEVEDIQSLQTQLLHSHHAGSGASLPDEDVKLAMILRVNSLCKGASAIRPQILNRYLDILNLKLYPDVKEHGSIGASGDLVPLTAIAGAVLGLSDEFTFNMGGRPYPAKEVLQGRGFEPLPLRAKEGLALINGTSCHTAIAINVFLKCLRLFDISLMTHAMISEVMQSDTRPFSAFIQQQRPHPGQIAIAKILRTMLKGSGWAMPKVDSHNHVGAVKLAQQRYSVRCMPQFLGPIYEELMAIAKVLEIEANSATDNPLIDADQQQIMHGGNFLGQHVAVAMDKLRMCLALLAKHNDAQIAMLVEPAYSDGLPPSLVDCNDPKHIVGVKPLQIGSNSLVPMIEKLADPICTRFPVHAEQFNQNINSQAFNSATLARQSVNLYEEQLAITLLVAHKAKRLRTREHSSRQWCKASSRLAYEVDKACGDTEQYSYQKQIVGLQQWLNSDMHSCQPFMFCSDEIVYRAHVNPKLH